MTAAIEVHGLGVRFRRNRRGNRTLKDLFAGASRRSRPGEFWALRDVSFSVAPGESIGVVGRNGQGKSTLLKLVTGVLLPDEGTVSVHAGVAPLIVTMNGGDNRLGIISCFRKLFRQAGHFLVDDH